MRAIVYEQTGPAHEVLRLVDLPTPKPGPGEVRVVLRRSGVNPSDVKSRAGLRSKVLAYPRIVPHSDGAGQIDAVGEGVPPSRIGERVWVWNAAWKRAFGTAADCVVLPQEQAVRLPDGTDFDAGACLGIPAMTALHAVLCDGGVSAQSVLVAGGAGAVGHYAVQFARALGARQVIGTVSSDDKAALARAAGADATVNYRGGRLAEEVLELTQGQGVDRIVEVDFAANVKPDLQMLKPNGTIVVYGSGAAEIGVPFFDSIVKGARMHFFIVYNLAAAERERAQTLLTSMLERGLLKHQIAERLPLEKTADAHALVESGRATGNVVLTME